MLQYKIKGGNSLRGKLSLHGAKNATLPILAATALTEEEVLLHNVPSGLLDVQIMIEILRALGKKVAVNNRDVAISGSLDTFNVPIDLGRRIRYSLLFLGILLNKLGRAVVPQPGGCNIGNRKFDLHTTSLQKMGAKIEISNNIEAECEVMKGCAINFYLPSTSGTQNVILAALGAEGKTIIKNANTRPENMDFANFLNIMGANIHMRNRIVTVVGKRRLHGTEYTIMNGPDELVSYILAAAVTNGEIQIENATLNYIPTDLKVLKEAGVELFEWGNSVYVSANKPKKPIDIFTTPYPGINSDMQPLYAVFAATSQGESTVTDMRFTDRFQYVEELRKFHVNIESYGNCAVIQGGERMTGCNTQATDLRGGFALVLAALAAQGTTQIGNIQQIERGYMNLPSSLKNLGADIEAVSDF